MEKRRTKALARAIGFQSLCKMLSITDGMQTSLVRSFADSLRRKEGKIHYWDGLEGVDPDLLACVKTCFFKVYESLQNELIMAPKREISLVFLHHYLALVEAMSYPFKESDSHMMLELKISQGMQSLLKIAKGYVGIDVDLVEFDNSKVITNIRLKKKGEQSEENSVMIMRLEEEEKEEEVEEENKSDASEKVV
eukprot:CAMPEP_0168314374 /NCGR_PEP_ID=MMETSP0210-20121227/7471_1 /TAXON_ID=40633 /ORGANISM="Condylostoma magnum, Strain COL2" /LENGTH=193 /DNA_ID=CAMNT_0008281055 /DNA_START=3812 /DNA_END=4393 /DNA_ORIENTATION=-